MLSPFEPRATLTGLVLLGLVACSSSKTVTVLGPFGTLEADSGTGNDTGTAPVASITPLTCASPTESVTYTESAAAMGLLDTTDGDPMRMMGNPIAIADFDDDGDDDIVLARRSDGIWLQRNSDGQLDATLVDDTPSVTSLALGDLDRDGDLDLVAMGKEPPVVLLNDGSGEFSVPAATGLEAITEIHRDVSLGDVDSDGDLDLFATADPFGRPEGTVFHTLWENDGTAHFTDISDRIDADARSGLGWHTLLTDLDGDLDIDLFTSNADQSDWGPNRLVLNEGIGSDGVEWRDGTDDCSCGLTYSAMGASVGDVNRDGMPDLYVTQSGPSVLLQNLSNGQFADATAAFGAHTLDIFNHMTFGSLLFDHDNDSWLDVAAVAGPMRGSEPNPAQPEGQTNVLLAGRDGGFDDVSTAMGFDDPGTGRAVAAGYLNSDPFLDLVVTNLDGPSRLYLSQCTEARALVVELRGQASPPFGEGARLELFAGGTVLTTWISANPGWAGAMHPRAHFGLGDLEPERLVVRWPSGRVQELALELEGSGRLLLSEPER